MKNIVSLRISLYNSTLDRDKSKHSHFILLDLNFNMILPLDYLSFLACFCDIVHYNEDLPRKADTL